jgi:hypothetical protein
MEKYKNLAQTKELFVQKIEDSPLLNKFSNYNFSQNFYAALCNTVWVDSNNNEFFFSWRGAGNLVSSIRNRFFETNEDYLDFYCSGIKPDYNSQLDSNFVEEGFVTPEVSEFMESLGVFMVDCEDIFDVEYFREISLC